MTPFLQLSPPREAQQVAAFMRGRALLILALAADNTAADRDMAADIRHYLAQKDSRFRSRTDYLAHFAAQRLPLHLETLRESLT